MRRQGVSIYRNYISAKIITKHVNNYTSEIPILFTSLLGAKFSRYHMRRETFWEFQRNVLLYSPSKGCEVTFNSKSAKHHKEIILGPPNSCKHRTFMVVALEIAWAFCPIALLFNNQVLCEKSFRYPSPPKKKSQCRVFKSNFRLRVGPLF